MPEIAEDALAACAEARDACADIIANAARLRAARVVAEPIPDVDAIAKSAPADRGSELEDRLAAITAGREQAAAARDDLIFRRALLFGDGAGATEVEPFNAAAKELRGEASADAGDR